MKHPNEHHPHGDNASEDGRQAEDGPRLSFFPILSPRDIQIENELLDRYRTGASPLHPV